MIAVMGIALVVMILVVSVTNYTMTERRLNTRSGLLMEARNAAEAVSEYGMAQIRAKMNDRSDFAPTRFTSGSDTVSMPAASFWSGGKIATTGDNAPGLIIGLIEPKSTTSDGLYYYNAADPANEFDALKGRFAFRFDIKIISHATAESSWTAPITVYMAQTLSARAVPLFSHAVFYNMDLELWPYPQMNIVGAVHTNGKMYAHQGPPDSGATLDFHSSVTAAGGFYTSEEKWGWSSNTGGMSSALSSTDQVRIADQDGNFVKMRLTSPTSGYSPNLSTNTKVDQKWGQSVESDATRAQFRKWASQTLNGNLQTNAHGIVPSNPPAIGEYVEDSNPYDGVDESINEARSLIEGPLLVTDTGYDAEVESQKYARLSGLFIATNTRGIPQVGRRPDGVLINVGANAYRAFAADSSEVILPGQATYGDANLLTNSGTNAAGDEIILLKDSSGSPRRMTDVRRADFDFTSSRSSSNQFNTKNLYMIDVDMAALKKAVAYVVNSASSTSLYETGLATSSNWNNHIYNANASPTNVSVSSANGITGYSSSDWNGGIYIHSIGAETNTDSGVRVINGRGKVASKSDSSGLSICTNDALYILGHFNADGTVQTGSGNSSAQFYESGEVPASLAADAISVLSQPTLSNSGGSIRHSKGWNDAASPLRLRSSGYSSSWYRSNPSYSNRYDGTNSTVSAYRIPHDAGSGTWSSNSTNIKWGASNTEISSALLTGLVPSNKDGNGENSGGLHNFPRMLEDWTSDTMAIRGSMVAMFESRIATEPWSPRIYWPPTRLWGFNQLFSEGTFPPLTPKVMNYRRVSGSSITKSKYDEYISDWGL